MSISPPHWVPGNAPWASGSYVGSFGALGTSFGRERDRELEAKYVRDFTCCGRQLNGLHDLLEQYVKTRSYLTLATKRNMPTCLLTHAWLPLVPLKQYRRLRLHPRTGQFRKAMYQHRQG